MNRVCVLLGGGGHARMVIDCLQAAGCFQVIGILEKNPALWGQTMLGIPILGPDGSLTDYLGKGVSGFAVGVGGTGNNTLRQRLFEWGVACGFEPILVKHPSAICSKWAKLGRGIQLLPGSLVNAGAELGANVIVNSGAIVEHDCSLGDHVHVATGARLCGGVRASNRAHIGAGATIRQGINIGQDAVVGAGAVVVKDVPADVTVVGVPARPLAVAG